MADLIDREELLNILEKNNEIYYGTAGGGYPVSKDIFEEIKFMNKADTERHAHWGIWDEDTNTYECSNCKNPFTLLEGTPEQNTYFYCPYCGCRMDEVEE